jgi:FkbM family methyltransferase
MWLRDLVKMRERYTRQRLPQPLDSVAWACWKAFGKPILKISTILLARSEGFTLPGTSEWELDLVLGLHEQETVELSARVIRPGMTVLDIGAHIGYFTRSLAKLVGRQGKVYAFEPHPENFHLLKRNTSQFSNVLLENKALSHMNSSARFFINTKSGCHSLFEQPHTFSSIEVEVTTLDRFWEELGRPNIDFIKMDIEGAEPYVLKGASQFFHYQKRLSLITEFCPAHLRTGGTEPGEFLDLLSGLGLRYAAIGPGGNLSSELPSISGSKYVNLYCEKS